MQRRTLVTATAFAATALAVIAVPSWAQSGEIRIAHVYSKTGALEAYGKQTQTGLMMGLSTPPAARCRWRARSWW